MYERVVNQLFSTESKSQFRWPGEVCDQVGLEKYLTCETGICEKVDEPHIVIGVAICVRRLSGEEDRRREEKGAMLIGVCGVCCEEIRKKCAKLIGGIAKTLKMLQALKGYFLPHLLG